MRKFDVFGYGMDVECEGGSEVGVTIEVMTQEEMIGLHRVGCEEETTDSDVVEAVRAFKNGWTGVTSFGVTVAGDETGDIVFNEALVEGGEQPVEALVCPAVFV
jgi:hypothetical protein